MVDIHCRAYQSRWVYIRMLVLIILLLSVGIPANKAYSDTMGRVVNPQITPTNFSYLPYLNKDSAIYFQNINAVPLTFGIKFYNGNVTVYASYPETPLSGYASIQIPLNSILNNGVFSAQIYSDKPFAASVSVHQSEISLDSKDLYPGFSTGTTNQIFGPVYKGVNGQSSQIAVMNIGGGPLSGNLMLYTSEGASALNSPFILSLGANVSTVISVANLVDLPTGFIGYAIATTSQPLAGLVLQVSNSSLHIVAPMRSLSTPYDGAYPRLFNHYKEGTGYQTSKLLLLNTGTGDATTNIHYYQQNEVASDSITLVKGAMKDVNLPTLAPNFAYSARLSAPGTMYSTEIRTDDNIPSGVANHLDGIQLDNAIALPGISTQIPLYPFLSVQNAGSASADSTLKFYNLAGTLVHSITIPQLGVGLTQLFDLTKVPQLTNFNGSALLTFSSPAAFNAELDVYDTGSIIHLPLVMRDYSSVSCIPLGSVADPYFSSQVNLQLIHAPEAWATCMSGNPAVTVAVLDTGVDASHPDLKDNLLPGTSFVSGDATTKDMNGHGTHVAGILAAEVNNYGVVGVAPKSQILPVKVLGPDGSGTVSGVAQGIIWAADRAQIISLSLGGPDFDQGLQDAITYAYNKGRLVVAAAGNNGTSGVPIYPAVFDHVIGVGAIDAGKNHWLDSNTGNFVDLSAPGVNILSTLPTYYLNSSTPQGFGFATGTSMATPHVSGLAALLWGNFPTASADQIFNMMKSTATDLGTAGLDPVYGWGLINAHPAGGFSLSGLQDVQTAGLEPQNYAVKENRAAEIVPGRVLVKYKTGLTPSIALNLPGYAPASVQVIETIEEIGTQILNVPVGSEWQAIDQLRADPNVEYAEPDYILHLIE